MNDNDTTEIKYKVTYGPLEKEGRFFRMFDSIESASIFFKDQESKGKHVDAYEVTTITKLKKLTC